MNFYSSNLEKKSLAEENLWLNISRPELKKAYSQTQNYSNTLARYNAYLNSICLQTFLSWLQGWLIEESQLQSSICDRDTLPSLWEVVNGTAIQIVDSRIILIPCETMDIEELRVPQEWVDIPSFVGDYYIAVQLNLEADANDCWMGVKGFATHKQLKNFGQYNWRERDYILPAESLTKNLMVMLITQGLQMQEQIPALPTLSEDDARKLLEKLASPCIYSPRLQVDIPLNNGQHCWIIQNGDNDCTIVVWVVCSLLLVKSV
ncbi:MAG: DUF1822 family protein [Calothrix sp. SM1_7_51]|nr:DUF1822 family protein [Calothrix sp. SM1_7_51]